MLDEKMKPLEAISMSDLESLVPELEPPMFDTFMQRNTCENAWICFEAEVRSTAAMALCRLKRHISMHGGERYIEIYRLCELEEQTRCQAFQAAVMREVEANVYKATVQSILDKLLAKLEVWSREPSVYQAAAQCISDYMSALNHHCDICMIPETYSRSLLPAIAETVMSDATTSELGSEDTETLSVHSSAGAMMDSDEAKKERRRQSNKKASVRYRAKRSASTTQIMSENAKLLQQVGALTTQNSVLTAENQLLKQQLAFIQGMMQTQQRPQVQHNQQEATDPHELMHRPGPGQTSSRSSTAAQAASL